MFMFVQAYKKFAINEFCSQIVNDIVRKLSCDIVSECATLLENCHPNRHGSDNFLYTANQQQLCSLIDVREETKIVNWKDEALSFVLRRNFCSGLEFHPVKIYIKVTKQGQKDHLFRMIILPRLKLWRTGLEIRTRVVL